MKTSDWLSIIALIVSLATFIWVEVKEWLKRPRLNLFLQIVTFIDKKTQEKEDMVVILMINDGYSPLIISQCKYTTYAGAEGEYGIYDELKAPYGVHEIVLPVLLKPADKFQLNFLRAAAIEKISSITLFDSHDKKYEVPTKDIKNVQDDWQRRSQRMKKSNE
jgi:hypothetical protein